MQKKIIWLPVAVLTAVILIAGLILLKRPYPVHIAYMSDANYLPYTMVSLYSAIKNKNKNSLYHIHLIAKDFSENDIKKIKEMEQKDVKIELVPVQNLNLDFSHLGRFSSFKISLQKIFIADYLPKVKKVLYLDADTLVQKDLTEVYNTRLEKEYAAAVKDGLMYQFPEHITELGLDWRNFYFNSGVMLLNLKAIRKDGIMEKAVIYFNTHQEVFGDQDVLNVVFGDKVGMLSYEYNCNSTFFEEKDAKFLSNFWQENVPQTPREVYDNAAILHFAGHKPWTPWFSHSYLKPLWEQYAKEAETKYHIIF